MQTGICFNRFSLVSVSSSVASSCDIFGGKPHSMLSNFPLIEQKSRRLQKVVIENKDFEKLISAQDSEVSFFYCNPPYFSTEDYYLNVGFSCNNHRRSVLVKICEKFLLSYNDCFEIRGLYSGFEIYSNDRLSCIEELTILIDTFFLKVIDFLNSSFYNVDTRKNLISCLNRDLKDVARKYINRSVQVRISIVENTVYLKKTVKTK